MQLNRNIFIASVGVLALSLGACSKEPTGQVLAVVNGDEITIDELNGELNGAALPPGVDKKMAQRQLLQQLIDRRLLAQAAEADGLDQDPAYVRQQRRMNEELLVRLYATKAQATVPVPDAKAVDDYVAGNPQMFAQRKQYKLTQISFPMVSDPNVIKAIEANKTMDELKATLTRLKIEFENTGGALDSGQIPEATLNKILAMPRTEPFVTSAGNRMVASIIVGEAPLIVPADKVKPLAAQSIRNENLGKIGEQRLKEARAKAEITYQPGFEKPAAPASK
jgi:peptidyl-prolyl cis-trans isomerase C